MSGDQTSSVWQGNNVRLRAIEPDDWEVFYTWNQDDEMARSLYFVPFPQSQEAVKRWVEKKSTEKPENDAFHWVIEDHTGEVVGSIATHSCDRRVGTYAYGLNVRREHRRHGYASQAIVLVLHYYFQELGYQKVSVGIHSFNGASVKLHEHLGFQLEGRQRRMVFTDGQYFDLLLYGLTVEEFRTRHDESGA